MSTRYRDTVGLGHASIAGLLSVLFPPLYHTFPRLKGKVDFGREATVTSVNDPLLRQQYRPSRPRAAADLGDAATGVSRDGLQRPHRDTVKGHGGSWARAHSIIGMLLSL